MNIQLYKSIFKRVIHFPVLNAEMKYTSRTSCLLWNREAVKLQHQVLVMEYM